MQLQTLWRELVMDFFRSMVASIIMIIMSTRRSGGNSVSTSWWIHIAMCLRVLHDALISRRGGCLIDDVNSSQLGEAQ